MTKLVIRVLDAEDHLLGWVEHRCRVRGDGCLRADYPVRVVMDCAGVAAVVSVHWADVHVESRVPCDPVITVRPGDTLTLFPDDAPVIVVGPIPGFLPQVTTKSSVAVNFPVGILGSRG